MPQRPTGSERIGYARVSSAGQNLDAQRDALKAAGCTTVFEDKTSGVSEDRPGWADVMKYVRAGDTLITTELSRMSRSLRHLLDVVAELEAVGAGIVSLREHIDTTTPAGRAFLSIMGAVAQMERELKAERAADGRAAAKARGRSGGRPRLDPEKLEQARILYENSEMSAREAAAATGVSRRSLFSYLQRSDASNAL